MDDPYQTLVESAFHFISYRPRSEREVRDFLLKKLNKRRISDKGIADRILSRLRELGYIDDEKFASWWIDQRASHKPKGARLIAHELKAKGVLVEDLTIDEVAAARQAIEKKLPLWSKLPKLEQKRKIYGFLGRRGFSGETIHRVIDEVGEGKVQY